MINEKLLDKNYYINKLTMFLRESYGIIPQIEVLTDWIKSINQSSEDLIQCWNIWDIGHEEGYYKNWVNELCGTGEEEKPFEPLDHLGNVLGCYRKNKIFEYIVEPIESGTEYNEKKDKLYIKQVGTYVKTTGDFDPSATYYIQQIKIINLSNEDFVDLIKVKIVQNNYDGTLESLVNLYQKKLHYSLYIDLIIGGGGYLSASCIVYLDRKKIDSEEEISENLMKIFKWSNLFIQSLGIDYELTELSDMSNLLILGKEYTDDHYAIYENQTAVDRDEAPIVIG